MAMLNNQRVNITGYHRYITEDLKLSDFFNGKRWQSVCASSWLTSKPLGIRTELPVPAMQSKSSPQHHFSYDTTWHQASSKHESKEAFIPHPFPSQNANEKRLRIDAILCCQYVCIIVYICISTCALSPEILFWLLVALDRSFIYCSMEISSRPRTCLHGMVYGKSHCNGTAVTT